MTRFQWLGCALLLLAALRELLRLRRGLLRPLPWLFRTSVWLAALLAIAEPRLVQRVADAVGIGRGADIVLYTFVLAFLATSFFLYSRQVRLQRQINAVVSHLAIAEARRGAGEPPGPGVP